MSREGFYVGKYRCWWDDEGTWLENEHIMFLIEPGYEGQIIEMLIRLVNSKKYNAEAQVHSTEED